MQQPSPRSIALSFNHQNIVRRGRVPLRACRPERRQAHLHAIDASPFSRLEQLDANRTPSPYQEANGLVLDRLKVESVVEMIITTSPNLSWYMLGDRTVSRLMWRSGTATVHQPFRRRHRVAAVSSLPSRSVTSTILQSADVVHGTPIFADFSSTGATSLLFLSGSVFGAGSKIMFGDFGADVDESWERGDRQPQ